MNDEAPSLDEKGPERTCIVTRRKGGKDTLIRFVVGPGNVVTPDIRAKLPGRGAWVLPEKGTVALAIKRKAFARAFKTDVIVSDDLIGLVDRLLETDAVQALSLANKAGLVVAGSMKVEKALAEKPVVGLVHAIEAGQDGIRKIAAATMRRYGTAATAIPRVQIFAEEQLDLALGRTHVIHAALVAGAASEGFITRTHRLEYFRGLVPLSAVGDEGSAKVKGDRDDTGFDADGEHTDHGPQDGIADE